MDGIRIYPLGGTNSGGRSTLVRNPDEDVGKPLHFPRPQRPDDNPARLNRSGSATARTAFKPENPIHCSRSGGLRVRPRLSDSTIERELGGYIVIGIMNKSTGLARETLVHLWKDEKPVDLFKAIRFADRTLRPLHLRLFSLKHVGAFGIYECYPNEEYHVPVEYDHQTEAALAELFIAYQRGGLDADNVWKRWICRNFNEGDRFPSKGRYALQLVLRWSLQKIVVFTLTPLLLSLAIGLWFMTKKHDPVVDKVAIVQTAWTISSYVVTTAGGMSLCTVLRFLSF
jgi:hypothetical protein